MHLLNSLWDFLMFFNKANVDSLVEMLRPDKVENHVDVQEQWVRVKVVIW